MRAPHLLGPDWEGQRWYATVAERDAALAQLEREHLYSRRGDRESVTLEPVER